PAGAAVCLGVDGRDLVRVDRVLVAGHRPRLGRAHGLPHHPYRRPGSLPGRRRCLGRRRRYGPVRVAGGGEPVAARGGGRDPGGGTGQGRAAAVLVLALRRDEGPQSGQRTAALGGDGGNGRLPAAARGAAARLHRVGGPGRRVDRATDRGGDGDRGVGPTGSQTVAGGVHCGADGICGAGRRSGRGERRCRPTGGPCLHQGTAVPRCRGVAHRVGHREAHGTARGGPPMAGGGRDRDRGSPGPGRDRAAVPVGDQRRGAGWGPGDLGLALRHRTGGGGPVGGLLRQGPIDDLAPRGPGPVEEPTAGREVGATQELGTGQVGALEQAPLVVLAAGAAGLSVLALPPLSGALAKAMGGHGEVTALELVVSAAIALAVVLLMRRLRAPELGWAERWLGLEAAAHVVVVVPVMRLAHLLARFDDAVLDRAVTSVAGAVPMLARSVARFDDEVLDAGVGAAARPARTAGRAASGLEEPVAAGPVEGLAGWVRRLGRLPRTPQSGPVHQYLVLAVAVLTVAVVAWSVYAVIG